MTLDQNTDVRQHINACHQNIQHFSTACSDSTLLLPEDDDCLGCVCLLPQRSHISQHVKHMSENLRFQRAILDFWHKNGGSHCIQYGDLHHITPPNTKYCTTGNMECACMYTSCKHCGLTHSFGNAVRRYLLTSMPCILNEGLYQAISGTIANTKSEVLYSILLEDSIVHGLRSGLPESGRGQFRGWPGKFSRPLRQLDCTLIFMLVVCSAHWKSNLMSYVMDKTTHQQWLPPAVAHSWVCGTSHFADTMVRHLMEAFIFAGTWHILADDLVVAFAALQSSKQRLDAEKLNNNTEEALFSSLLNICNAQDPSGGITSHPWYFCRSTTRSVTSGCVVQIVPYTKQIAGNNCEYNTPLTGETFVVQFLNMSAEVQ